MSDDSLNNDASSDSVSPPAQRPEGASESHEQLNAPEEDSTEALPEQEDAPASDAAKDSADTEGHASTEDSSDESLSSDSDDSEQDEIKLDDIYLILLQGEDSEKVMYAVEQREKALNGKATMINQAQNIPGGYDDVLISAATGSREAQDSQKRIQRIIDNGGKLLTALHDADGKPILGAFRPPVKPLEQKNVSGEDALYQFRRRSNKGAARRIPLFNSGIYIDLTGPSAAELNNFHEQAAAETSELGRVFGAVYYTHMAHHIRAAAWALIRPHITYASIKNWDRQNTLAQTIRVEDYDVILMAMASLMYPDGYEGFKHPCLNTSKCSHVLEPEAVDLFKMIHHDFSKLNKDAQAHMRKALKNEVSMSEVAEYQKLIPFVEPGVDDDPADANLIRWKNWGFVLQSPSYYSYLAAGNRYLDRILDGINRSDHDTVLRALEYRLLRMLAPFIAEIRMYDDESNDISLSTSDTAVIEELMDDVQTEDLENEVYDKLSEAISAHKVSHVGYPVFDCPKCGHTPDIPSGIFTLEPLEAFFTVCVRKLGRLG